MFLRAIVATALLGVCTAFTTAAATATAPVDGIGPKPGCDYSYRNEKDNNGFLIRSSGGFRAYLDHRLQVATAARLCDPDAWVRGVGNIRCQRLGHGSWEPTPCGSSGRVVLRETVDGRTFTSVKDYRFDSTGTDGITTVYGQWAAVDCDATYKSTVQVDLIEIGRTTWGDLGSYGATHPWSC